MVEGGDLKGIMRQSFLITLLALCALVCVSARVSAQEGGGDLGGAGAIFRPKNPETKKRINKPKPVVRPKPNTGGGKPELSPAEIEDRVDDALEEGNAARDERDYAKAERAYRTALKLNPRDARAAQGLGNIYIDQQRWDEAEKAYRQALAFSSSNVDALIALSFVLSQESGGPNAARRLVDAETFARRAVGLQPNNAVAQDRLGSALEGRALLNKETEDAYRRAIEIDPDFAVAYIHLATLLTKTNRAADAAPLYKRATELAKDPLTLILSAVALQSVQRWDDSEPVLRRALEMDARSPAALVLLGRYLSVRRRYDEAEPTLKKAIEISPRSIPPYVILGSVYLRTERFEDAEQLFNRAAEFANAAERKQLAGAFGFSGVGDGFMKSGRPKDALRAYQHALELDPDNTTLQSKLSDARERSNR